MSYPAPAFAAGIRYHVVGDKDYPPLDIVTKITTALVEARTKLSNAGFRTLALSKWQSLNQWGRRIAGRGRRERACRRPFVRRVGCWPG